MDGAAGCLVARRLAHEPNAADAVLVGVGGNTPVIIKYPFWRMAASSHKATYACVNLGESFCPREIVGQSVLLDAGITQVLGDVAREL